LLTFASGGTNKHYKEKVLTIFLQVRGLLFKLQAIFDLPKRLHTALEQGAVEIAVNAFADAAPLLKRYGHKVIIQTLCLVPC